MHMMLLCNVSATNKQMLNTCGNMYDRGKVLLISALYGNGGLEGTKK